MLIILAVLLAVFAWPLSARVVRSLTLSIREREYVLAARFMGLGAFRIIRCQPFNRGGFDTVPERFPGRFWRRNPDQSAPPGTDEAHPCAQASTPCSHQE